MADAIPYKRFRRPQLPQHDFQRRDSRQFGQPYSQAASDLLHEANVQDAIAREGLVPLSAVIPALTAHNLPPQLVQGSFLKRITGPGRKGAALLIPRNPLRQGFLVANFIAAPGVLFSFDAPIDMNDGVIGETLAGIPMGGYYQEANGSVSTNDIYVFTNDPTAPFPIPMLGYEANLSIVGNKR